MPSDYKPPIYQIPSYPSRQLKVVLDYFNSLKTWDLETLSQLSTPSFTQATLPASLSIPVRTKEEDIAFLHTFRDSLKSAPLEVCNIRKTYSSLVWRADVSSKIIIHGVNESKGNIWVHVRHTLFLILPAPFPCVRDLSHIDRLVFCAVDDENSQRRVLFLIHVWNGQQREPHH